MMKPMVLVYLTVLTFATATSYLVDRFTDTVLPSDDTKQIEHTLLVEDDSIIEISETPESNALAYAIMAEVAKYHHDYPTALQHYEEASQLSQSPAILREATELALDQDDPQAAASLARHWASVAPNDLSAQLIAATLLIDQTPEAAKPYLIQALETTPDQMNEHIAAIQMRLPQESRAALYKLLADIASLRPKDAYAQLIAAQSALSQHLFTDAQRWLNATFALRPDMTTAIELQAKLIRYHDVNDTKALGYLKAKIEQRPEDHRLRTFYTHALLDAKEYHQAIQQLEILTHSPTYKPSALLLLGEIWHQLGHPQQAIDYMTQALVFKEKADIAHYLLGQLYIQQGNKEKALSHFSEITEGEYYISATLNTALLLSEQKQYAEALDVLKNAEPDNLDDQKKLLLTETEILMQSKQFETALSLVNEALIYLPLDEDFLLQRGFIQIELKQPAEAEASFQKILSQEPEHADALNALGFLLTQQPGRFPEARQYIEQALRKTPHNPYYMDSMGWLEYLSGNPEKALPYLKQAYLLSKDVEIATHLAEVLWQLGRKEAASNLWQMVFKQEPDNAVFNETITRLKIKLPEK